MTDVTNDFHKPFIKSLIVVAVITLITMVSSKFVIEYYYTLSFSPPKTIKYSSQQSQEQVYSSFVE
jgi:hypothetical protein